MPVAGKTGTTSSNRDRWFCGYTPYYTAAVWTGYDTPASMSFSGNPATQIWQKIMQAVHQDLEYKDFEVSYGGSATGIFGTREELEEQMLTEDERKAKEEEEKKKKEEEERKAKEEKEKKKEEEQRQQQEENIRSRAEQFIDNLFGRSAA